MWSRSFLLLFSIFEPFPVVPIGRIHRNACYMDQISARPSSEMENEGKGQTFANMTGIWLAKSRSQSFQSLSLATVGTMHTSTYDLFDLASGGLSSIKFRIRYDKPDAHLTFYKLWKFTQITATRSNVRVYSLTHNHITHRLSNATRIDTNRCAHCVHRQMDRPLTPLIDKVIGIIHYYYINILRNASNCCLLNAQSASSWLELLHAACTKTTTGQ